MTLSHRPLASLSDFLHHILKHSRTTHSTLQLAVFYLLRVRARIRQRIRDDVYVACGRRMFLAALICSHKFLQDKSFKNSAWSKLSGLGVPEVNRAERVMLQLLDYKLYVQRETYHQWVSMLQTHLKLRPAGVWERMDDAQTSKQPITIPTMLLSHHQRHDPGLWDAHARGNLAFPHSSELWPSLTPRSWHTQCQAQTPL